MSTGKNDIEKAKAIKFILPLKSEDGVREYSWEFALLDLVKDFNKGVKHIKVGVEIEGSW